MALLLILFWLAVFSLSASSSPCDKAIFLLDGQSNMAGRGGTYGTAKWDGYTHPLCRCNPRILRLNNEMVWEEAHVPLHGNISFFTYPGSKTSAGVGPGMPFANILLKRYLTIGTIGLVPCASVGTAISDWRRGSCLYNKLLTRARASLSDGGSLRGLLWYQGESEATESSVGTYEEKLRTFFNDIRNDLTSPWLPIIQVALASPNISKPAGRKIRSIQLHLKLPNLTCMDAKWLALNPDKLHLTTDAQVKLGSKMSRAFLKHFT